METLDNDVGKKTTSVVYKAGRAIKAAGNAIRTVGRAGNNFLDDERVLLSAVALLVCYMGYDIGRELWDNYKSRSPESAEFREVSGDNLDDLVVNLENGTRVPLVAVPQENGSTKYFSLQHLEEERRSNVYGNLGNFEGGNRE